MNRANIATLFLVSLACFISTWGCATRPDNTARSELSRILESHDYTLYTPLRTSDLPGTIFALTRNHKGQWTELTLADYRETFEAQPGSLFDAKGQQVDFASELTKNFDFNGSVGLDLLSLVLNVDLTGDIAKTVTIRFSDPKIKYSISLSHLQELKPSIRDSVARTLRTFYDQGQLNHCYLVLETLQVEGVEVNVTLKDNLSATASFEKVKAALKVDVTAKMNSDSSFVLKTPKPMIIGYKAITVPKEFVGTASGVSDVREARLIPAFDLNEIKSK